MTFSQTLSELLALAGSRINVEVASRDAEPTTTLSTCGTLLLGTELNGVGPGSEFERLFFPFEESPGAGFYLDRLQFRGASRWGRELRVDLNQIVLRISPADD
jgi:hypothetical protein